MNNEYNKKKVIFFIDSLGGGGAERVVSVLSNNIVNRDFYDVSIVMLRKVPTKYDIDKRIKLVYAQDLPINTLYGKFIKKMFLYRTSSKYVYYQRSKVCYWKIQFAFRRAKVRLR